MRGSEVCFGNPRVRGIAEPRVRELELRLDRMCVPIDYNKVVPEQVSPDGKYYACWRDPNYPYCFILPLEV